MKAVVGLLLVVVVVGLVAVYGCGPRASVAGDKIVAQIDKVLGEMEVKKKKIEQDYRKLQSDMDNVRAQRIGTEVRLETLKKKQGNSAAEIDIIKGKMTRLSALVAEVKESGSIERNGKTYTAEDLNKTAQELVEDYNKKKTEMETNLKTSIDAMERSLEFLKKQETAGKQMMEQIATKMEEIDSRKVAMDAVKSATATAGGQTSITDKYQSLNKEIEDLFANVETAMRTEEEKLKDLESHTSTADELLAEPTDLDATMSQLDAILGKSAGDDK